MKCFKIAYKDYLKIKLVDRCLIVFMMLLLAQCIYGLFSGESDNVYTVYIDVVVRSTSAAIFGYFLSANFNKKAVRLPVQPQKEGDVATDHPEIDRHTSDQQIIIATAIGLVSLVALLIARNFMQLTAASVATASHLRDLVLGCVGFLVGCPVSTGDQEKK